MHVNVRMHVHVHLCTCACHANAVWLQLRRCMWRTCMRVAQACTGKSRWPQQEASMRARIHDWGCAKLPGCQAAELLSMAGAQRAKPQEHARTPATASAAEKAPAVAHSQSDVGCSFRPAWTVREARALSSWWVGGQGARGHMDG